MQSDKENQLSKNKLFKGSLFILNRLERRCRNRVGL